MIVVESDRIQGELLKEVVETAIKRGFVHIKFDPPICRDTWRFELDKEAVLDIALDEKYGGNIVIHNCEEKGKPL